MRTAPASSLLATVLLAGCAFAGAALGATTIAYGLSLNRSVSSVGFMAHTSLFDVDGQFGRFEIEGSIDPQTLEPRGVRATVFTDSLDTGLAIRDASLRETKDLFDVEVYPTATLLVDSLESRPGEGYQLLGRLQIKDVVKSVSLPVQIDAVRQGGVVTAVRVRGRQVLDRTSWNMPYRGSRFLPTIYDEVDLLWELQLSVEPPGNT